MEPTTSPETLSEPPDGEDEVEPRPLGMMIVAAIVALAVGGLAGFAIGFKVEQNRVKSKNKSASAAKVAQPAARRAQPAGTVTAVSPTSITIKNAKGKNRVINVSTATVIDKSGTGGAADILQGATILVQGKAAPDGSFDAAEIIVLPASSKFAGGG